MISLRGARVLLVDDISDEAMPIIKAFAKRGIPVAYFDGNINDLPAEAEKLKGVRLAILDMDLVGGGDTPDNKISTLIARLQAILASDNGPYTMIAWTKHIELVDLLETKLFALYQKVIKADSVPLPVVCIRLEKQNFKIGGEENPPADVVEVKPRPSINFDLEKLSSSVEGELKKSLSLDIMQTWEERGSIALTGATNSISDMVTTSGDSLIAWRAAWNKSYWDVLVSLAKEEIGEDNLNRETFLKALFGALNPLQMDLLETDQISAPVIPEGVLPGQAPQDPPAAEQARPVVSTNLPAGKINTKLHLSLEDVNQFKPGNIYKLSDCGDIFPLQPKELFDDFVQKDHKENGELFKLVFPILIEVSAACDFAQNKIKVAKFLSGLVIPKSEIKKFKQSGGSILSLNPLWIEEQDRCILLSSQYLVSLELAKAKQLKAFARLRSQWLTNTQFWLAQQISRPGVMMLR